MASNNTTPHGSGGGGGGGGVKDLSRAKWSKQTLHIFCDLCIQFAENNSKDNKHSAPIPRMAWKVLQLEFQKKTNLPYGKHQLKNKWDWMKSRWTLWKAFKANETGLLWDSHKATIAATDDWWHFKIQQNIHFKAFREEGIEPLLEAKMELLFGALDSSPQLPFSDKETLSLSSPPSTNAADDQISDNSACNHSHLNIEWQELRNDHTPLPSPTPLNYTDFGATATHTKTKRLSHADSSESNKRRCKSCFARGLGVKLLEEKIDALAKAVTDRNVKKMEFTSLEQRPLQDSSHTVADSIAKLVSMPGLIHGSPEFCFACTLIEDPQKRTILHGIPDDHSRLEWIKFLYGKHRND